MLDAHCHIDLYPDPSIAVDEAAAQRVTVVAVTNLPSHYEMALPHLESKAHVKLALGLHPLMSAAHKNELPRFLQFVRAASFIGEVGLDFSKAGSATAEEQIKSLNYVLGALADRPRFVTLHSRKAEEMVLELLTNHKISGAVFHWYTGSLTTLELAVQAGHYFSVNPEMILSKRWKQVATRIPRDRMLTETDGPYVHIEGRSAKPGDVSFVIEALAELWNMSTRETEKTIQGNFGAILRRINDRI